MKNWLVFAVIAIGGLIWTAFEEIKDKQLLEPEFPPYYIVDGVTATAYSAPGDGMPTASGMQPHLGICAVSRGMEKIAPLGSQVFVDNHLFLVADRTNGRFIDLRVDLYVGEIESVAKEYGIHRGLTVVVIPKEEK